MGNLSVMIKIELLKNSKTQADIARELTISHAAVSQFVKGSQTSSRFDEWVRQNLGLDLKILREKQKK